VKLKNEANREALFCRYLSELHGNTAQTMYLSANYKLFEMENWKREATLAASLPLLEDVYASLTVGGNVYKAFVQHVDGVFANAVFDCYGRFVSLTEPIVSQTTISRLVGMFKTRFPDQYWGIACLLNYNMHMKKVRSEHLLPFYHN
jgi:hypothetical protein